MAHGCRAHSPSAHFQGPKFSSPWTKPGVKPLKGQGTVLALRRIARYLPGFPAESTEAQQGYKADEQF